MGFGTRKLKWDKTFTSLEFIGQFLMNCHDGVWSDKTSAASSAFPHVLDVGMTRFL
jgi:hypothetical protein